MLFRNPTSIRYEFVFLCLIVLFGVLTIAPVPHKVGAHSSQRTTASLPGATDWLKGEAGFGTTTGALQRYQKLFGQTGGFNNQGDSQKRNAINPVVLRAVTASRGAPSPERSLEQMGTQMAALKQDIARSGETPALMLRYDRLANQMHALARQSGDFKNPSLTQKGNVSNPLVPEANVCISNSLGAADNTYKRPDPTFPTNCPGGAVPVNAPTVRYDAFGFNLTGCTTFPTNVTVSMCAAAPCAGDTGQNIDTILFVHRTGGATGTGGAVNPFNSGDPCPNLVGSNDDGAGCGAGNDSLRSNLTISLGSGHFVVVIAAFSGTLQNTGNYHLLVDAPGANCSITQEPTAADGTVSGTITDGAPIAGAVINLSGTQSRKTITDANGNYRFDGVETSGFYTVTPSRANYSFSPAERSFSQLGNSTEAAFTAVANDDGVNPLDTPEYFVRQHYLDFLGREPDESGFNFWSDQILECGSDADCVERRTINVSAAYFLSIEFQQTGGLVDGLYRASYGVRPQFAEFMPDTQTIARDVVVGRTGWEQLLTANKQAFLDDWVNRPAFRAAYDLLTNDRYVDALIAHTGISFTPSERDALVNGLTLGTLSRASVLQRIAEDERFVAAKRNETFVMMEYFGYLRRDPDASGFQFWLNKLNQFGGNFEQAEMVKAFIVSSEYRGRFPR